MSASDPGASPDRALPGPGGVTDGAETARCVGALIGALVAGGARRAVVSPGSRNTPVVLALEALEASGALDSLHVILDERAAGFFALGLARTSGAPVLLSCTSGSAGGHYLPAIIEAGESGVPLIALTADRPPELQSCGAPQAIDQRGLFGVHVRRTFDLGAPHARVSGGWIRGLAARALDAATGARPGPVHLNLPLRKPLWAPDAPPSPTQRAARVLRGPARIDDAALDALAERLSQAPRGAIVCGPIELTPGEDAPSGALRLAEALGWPLIADPTSQRRTPGAIATADAILRDPTLSEALAPGAILQLGRVPTSNWIQQWITRHGAERTTLVNRAGDWLDPLHVASEVIAADPEWLCGALADRIVGARESARRWLAWWRAADARAALALAACCAGPTLWEGAIARAVAAAVPPGGLLHAASSMPIRDLDAFAAPRADLGWAANRGANGIDGAIATALGEASAGGRPTALLTGDLSALHDLGGLALARGSDAPLTVVIVDNGGGGIFHLLPIHQHPTAFERFFVTPQPHGLPDVARGLGVPCAVISDLPELEEALRVSLAAPGVQILYARVDRADSLRRRSDAWAAVRAALVETPPPTT